jgi:RsiW-degrading membrane proteinase PrsW (M82 family)
LLLRYYAHAKDYPTTLKAVITTFFVTVVLFMWAMLRYKFITF